MPLASILPLAFVVGIAMLKEAVEDYVLIDAQRAAVRFLPNLHIFVETS